MTRRSIDPTDSYDRPTDEAVILLLTVVLGSDRMVPESGTSK